MSPVASRRLRPPPPGSFLTNLQRCSACFPDTAFASPPSCPLHPHPSKPCCTVPLKLPALKSTKWGWHCLVSWPNGCLFKHWGCLHCCGSLHVKHSPLKPYANPIKVSAVQRGEAITIKSQACLLSWRKENLIEQLKAKSDSVQHHVEDTRFNGSWAYGGQEEINGRAGESNCTLLRGL